MRLTDLAGYLRGAGLTVVEHPGASVRGVDLAGKPDTIVCHHTATSPRARGDLPSLGLLISGRPDLAGPLCQLALSRAGIVHVISTGKANHAGPGEWRGQTRSGLTIGIEAEHPGGDTPWTAVQYDAYVTLCAALCRYLEVDANRVCAHREWALPAGRKTDVTFDMDDFRRKVRERLAHPSEDDVPLSDDDVKKIVKALVPVIDDRFRVLMRGEKRDGTPTGHTDTVRAIRADLAEIKEKLG